MLRKILIVFFVYGSAIINAQTTDTKEYSTTGDLLATAGKLVLYGYETETVLPLIQAIEIYNRIGVADETESRQKTTEYETVIGDTVPKTSIVSYKVDQLIADATKFADGNKNLLALIKSVSSTRGRVGGPVRHYDTVNAYSTDSYSVTFRGGELAKVYISGDGDTDLELMVYDALGNCVGSDEYYCENCGGGVCFTPRWTGTYTIKIKNRGKVYNRYVMITN